ncbi:hypothetical protein MG293_019205 [Ovis ammon polii]|uniref:Uncharacterized protein n=1 Tax=Ovis ammon polii TaxID=230172 RepID=A0AAD4TNF5_OVIAM|nr:hypothetical protein MG293_019205 [Ovis ammon polii]
MAGYLSPAAYLCVDEQEYLQAYEDVLERYKAGHHVDLLRELAWGSSEFSSLTVCFGESAYTAAPVQIFNSILKTATPRVRFISHVGIPFSLEYFSIYVSLICVFHRNSVLEVGGKWITRLQVLGCVDVLIVWAQKPSVHQTRKGAVCPGSHRPSQVLGMTPAVLRLIPLLLTILKSTQTLNNL